MKIKSEDLKKTPNFRYFEKLTILIKEFVK